LDSFAKSIDVRIQALIQRLELTAATRAVPDPRDSTACDRAAPRAPSQSRATRSAPACASEPIDDGEIGAPGDRGALSTASRWSETDPPPVIATAAPHRVDRVFAVVPPPSESPRDAPRDTRLPVPPST